MALTLQFIYRIICNMEYTEDDLMAQRADRWPSKEFKQGPAHTAHEQVIRSLLGGIIGEDVDREGLAETPARVVKAWKHWCGGYKINVQELIKMFSDGAEGADEMVVRKGIRIYSHCEHHLAPIIGDCTIAYIPNGKVIGLSKLDRVADAFARRLQVQERLTSQIADALWEGLEPLGVGVFINAKHMCVESRGVAQHNSDTATSALRGVIKTEASARAEFYAMAR
jgi:GTP cyclohydrolase IA